MSRLVIIFSCVHAVCFPRPFGSVTLAALQHNRQPTRATHGQQLDGALAPSSDAISSYTRDTASHVSRAARRTEGLQGAHVAQGDYKGSVATNLLNLIAISFQSSRSAREFRQAITVML
ncbi:hypothetical protein F5888DRAFT_1657194 [Russula emetica]|nr:hypothetical protein F5888DRAFT_1657194 [Russula emetica]